MRTRNNKIIFTISMPVGVPDHNGYIYTKEAIENAIKNTKRIPIKFSDKDSKIIGLTEDKQPQLIYDEETDTYNCTFTGNIFFGGTSETIKSMEGNTILDYTIDSVGISL